MKKTKEKKIILPNECSFGRWLLTLVVGLLIGFVLVVPLYLLLYNREGTFMGISYTDIFGVLSFVPLFWAVVFSIRVICKTSLKDFMLGVGGKINVKESLIILGLFLAGFAVPYIIVAKNIEFRSVKFGEFAFLVALMLLTAWMQTTFEELVFRGILIRWGCKNKVGYTKKSLILAAITTVLFAIFHAFNPEVLSQKGFLIPIAIFTYAIPGFVFFIVNLHFGSLLPGCIIHFINNFLLFTVISSEISVVTNPTLLIDKTPGNAIWSMTSTILTYLPLMIYIVVDVIRRKKVASMANKENQSSQV